MKFQRWSSIEDLVLAGPQLTKFGVIEVKER